jgi:hypothetical protein
MKGSEGNRAIQPSPSSYASVISSQSPRHLALSCSSLNPNSQTKKPFYVSHAALRPTIGAESEHNTPSLSPPKAKSCGLHDLRNEDHLSLFLLPSCLEVAGTS